MSFFRKVWSGLPLLIDQKDMKKKIKEIEDLDFENEFYSDRKLVNIMSKYDKEKWDELENYQND